MTLEQRLRALRRRLRPLRLAGQGLRGRLIVLALRCTRLRAGVVLVYHRVGSPAGDPGLELLPQLDPDRFQAQLRLLRSRFRLVPAAELDEAIEGRRRGGRFPVALTFDDDWHGHADVTLALLGADVPATFFLGGASAEGPYGYWYERVQRAFDQGVLTPPEAVHAEAMRIEAMPAPHRRELIADLVGKIGPDPAEAGLRAEAIGRIVAAGHEIGFHTREHDTLPTLDDEELRAALRDGRERLEVLAGQPLQAFAYPSGKADGRVVEETRKAGFARAYTTQPTAVTPTSDPLRLGRVYPPDNSVALMELVIARPLVAARSASAR